MKLIDRDGRLFGKISVIDVIVLAVVVVLVAAVFTKTRMPQTGATVSTVPVVYTMRVQAQPEYMLDAIQVGDQQFDEARSTGGSLGTITDVQVSDGTYQASLNDGTVAMVPAEGYYDLLLTIEGEALVEEGGMVLLNRVYALGVNTNRAFITKYASFTGRVMSIQISETDSEG